MAEIRWTAEAERWLRDIYDYIAQDNPSAAAKGASGIYERAQVLKNFPEVVTSIDQRKKETFRFYFTVITESYI